MGKRKKDNEKYNEEFPLLDQLELYAAATLGDGNCLFRALSDQMYSEDGHFSTIRRDAVEYLKKYAEHFAAFIGEYGESFDQYLKRMSRDGVYGGHLELVAVANVYSYEIAIYQADYMYVVHPNNNNPKKRLHIAYHTWEHYSSVRQKSDNGLPEKVNVDNVSLGKYTQRNEQSEDIPRWKVEIVLRSVPDANEATVCELLQKYDHGEVIEKLLMSEFETDPDHQDRQDHLDESANAPNSETVQNTPVSNETEPTSPKGARQKRQQKRRMIMEKRQARREKTKVGKSGANGNSSGKAPSGQDKGKASPQDLPSKEQREPVKVIHI